MRRRFTCLSVIVMLLSLGTASRAQDPAKQDAAKSSTATPKPASTDGSAQKTVRLLTIGNSFSQNATSFLDDIAAADGNTLIQRGAVVGGSPLQLHWERAELHERDPADAKGTYGKGQGLKELLTAEKYDFVTIQQASLKSHDGATYRPYAEKLRDYVKKYAPDAELLIHETWAYRVDDPRFAFKNPKAGEPLTQREMYDGLHAAYKGIADELKLRVIPVGTAFITVDEDPTWGYKPDASFDAETAASPALPDQRHSLHMGRSWKKGESGVSALVMDGHHANTAGQYLGACVWYETLFGVSCVGNAFRPKGLDNEFAAHLQQVAHETVAKGRKAVASER